MTDSTSLDGKVNRYGPTSARQHGRKGREVRPKSITIDVHSHIFVPEAAAYAGQYVDLNQIPLFRFATKETREINQQQDRDRTGVMTNIDERLAELDAMGIDLQLVAPPPPQCYYTIPAEHAQKASQIVNDGVAAFVAQRPERFLGLGTVPLQAPDLAVKELDRLVNQLGLKGIQVLTNVAGAELSDPRFEPVFAKAAELGALIMLHPNGFTEGERLTRHYFNNIIGNPFESTLALHNLIFDGVLERLPDLKLLAVHGGGYLAAYSGRIDHAWGARRDARAGLPRPPGEYLRRVYFDSVVFTPHQLEYLVKVFGVEKILMGTDYPYDMAEYDPIGHLAGCSALSEADVAAIAGTTAAKLLGVSR